MVGVLAHSSQGLLRTWSELWGRAIAGGALCVCVWGHKQGEVAAFWEQIIVMSWIMELVCVCILICAGLWGFIMRSLNLPNDELHRGSVSVCVRVHVCVESITHTDTSTCLPVM